MGSGDTPQKAWDSYTSYRPPQTQYPFIKAEPGFFEKALGAIKKRRSLMEIHINGKYVITSNAKQFILNKKMIVQSGKRAGEPYLQQVGFHPKLSSLITALIQMDVRTTEVTTLQEMDDRIQTLAELIEPAVASHIDCSPLSQLDKT